MRYTESYNYLNSFSNFEEIPGIRQSLEVDGLERVRLLLRLLARPQDSFKSIIVAGTKGKGSTAAMIEAVLREAGYVTGLFTSPHLHTFRERIRVGGKMIPPEEMSRLVEQIKTVVERIRGLQDPSLVPSTYELATVLAFLYFKEKGVKIAVLEVGLGGRLDAVNVTDAVVSVITPISLDHTRILGDTVAKIAWEKAGVIKPGKPVISAPQNGKALEVINKVAEDRRSPLAVVGRDIYVGTGGHLPEVVSDDEGIPVYQVFTVGFAPTGGDQGIKLRLKIPLLGNHQQINAAVALAALRALEHEGIEVDREALFRGFMNVQWPGRLEVVNRNPLAVVDGAHNVQSISRLGEAISVLFHGREVVIVLGMSNDKDLNGILKELGSWSQSISGPTVERIIATKSKHPRSAEPKEIAQNAITHGLTVEIRDDVPKALARAEAIARAGAKGELPGPMVLVTGSLFVVAEAREYYNLQPDLAEEQE